MAISVALVGLCGGFLLAQAGAVKGAADQPVLADVPVVPVPAPPEAPANGGPAATSKPLETRLDRLKAENDDVPAHARVVVRNQMGKRFRFVEARFVVDGKVVAEQVAPGGQELASAPAPFELLVPAGKHVLTATLIFTGRNAGPFTYLDDYRFRVESTVPFEAGHLIGPATIDVVASERPGANLPIEQKPFLTMTAVNHPAR